jgi:hypothetical protein
MERERERENSEEDEENEIIDPRIKLSGDGTGDAVLVDPSDPACHLWQLIVT